MVLDLNVLVVEDSRTQAEALRFILEKAGCRVSLAKNGKEAIGRIPVDRPSVVLTDILMPEMDGYDLCRRIKTDPATAGIPVILVTQLYQLSDVVKGLECGADNFIIKPFEPAEIYARIQDAVRAVRPERNAGDEYISITMEGSGFTIPADRERIVHILLSTYEIAIRKNEELLRARDELGHAHALLNDTAASLRDVNASLRAENERRLTGERALAGVNRKLQLMASITRHDLLNQLTALIEHLDHALGHSKSGDRDGDCTRHVRDAGEILAGSLSTVEFTGTYQQIGGSPPSWFVVRALISAALPETGSEIAIENIVAPGMKVYADPLIADLFANLIRYRVRNCRAITRFVFASEAGANGPRIVCSDNGAPVPREEKEAIFSFGSGLASGLELFLARELLAMTGIAIRETGTAGGWFEILCTDSTASLNNTSSGAGPGS